jgi:2-dehydro-3-deoxyphosphogluconate aldolase/(4S)-4-hydroxy-2-oxoglutarate aldolase
MQNLSDLFFETGVIPVIKIQSADRAEALADTLVAGHVRVAEITFRTKSAAEAIERMVSHRDDIVVGAGTVTTKAEVDASLAAGAKFIVSPGFNPDIVRYCQDKGVPVFPGVNNPSLIEQAAALGLTTLKFFPAEISGGVKALKTFESVYSGISFMPTGGIQENNIAEYLALSNVTACGGSWIVPTDKIEAGDFDTVSVLLKSCMKAILGFQFQKVILPENGDNGLGALAAALRDSAGFDGFGILSSGGKEKAVLSIKTNSVRRAAAFLKAEGFASFVRPGSGKGKPSTAILDMPGASFCVELTE